MARGARGPVELEGLADLSLLGRGGFSEVYRARQVGFDRWVAVKVLDVGLDTRQRTAFERECRAMGVVSQHPNIVTVLSAAYTSDDRPAIVMELYSGGTLAQRLRREGPLPAADVLDLGVRICGALQTAHDRQLLHRDVKPQNLFLSEYSEPALGDFGISSFAGDHDAGGGLTVHYAAPEVIEDGEIGPATDLYALAATLFTLVAGRRPFASSAPGGGEVAEVALRILREPPPRVGAGCPPGLERVLHRTLAKQPEDRPGSASELGALLQEVQEQLSTARTPMAVARSPVTETDRVVGTGSSGPDLGSPSGATDDSSSSATVLRPTPGVGRETAPPDAAGRARQPRAATPGDATAERDAGDHAPPARRRRSLFAGAAAVIALIGLGIVVVTTGGVESPAVAPTADEVDPSVLDDDFLIRLDPPEDLQVVRAEPDGVRVRWSGQEHLRYEVERADAAGSGSRAVTVDGDEVVLPDIDAATDTCVVVRAIDPEGRISPATDPVCVAGSG